MFKQSSSEILNSLSVIFFSVPGCLNNVAANNLRIQFPIELNFLKAAFKTFAENCAASGRLVILESFPQASVYMKKFSSCTRVGKMEVSS